VGLLKATSLYPLRFDPISLYRLWGGEVWLLSDRDDRDDRASQVSSGPLPVLRENLIQSDYFGVTRISGRHSFVVGAAQRARVLVCLCGEGHLEHAGATSTFGKGDTLLLPTAVGACACLAHGSVSVLEIALPAG
jgi:hypothetical protein